MRWKSTFIPLLQKELSHHSRSYETCATGNVLFVYCYCQSSSWHSGIDMHKIKHTCLNYTQEQETALYLQGTVAWLVHLLTLKWSVFMLVLPLWKVKGKVSSDLLFFYCRPFESSLEIMIILIYYNSLFKASHHFCFQPVGNLLSCYNWRCILRLLNCMLVIITLEKQSRYKPENVFFSFFKNSLRILTQLW